jgi:small multidrug resistance family-3 protein
MIKFINKALDAARKYNMWDYGVLKICLFSLGVVIGAAFPTFFQSIIVIVAVVFTVSYLYLIYKTFGKYWDK